MADLDQLGLTSSYRLGVPDYRAFDPNATMLQYTKALSEQAPISANVSGLVGAMADRDASAAQYQGMFEAANQKQYDLGVQRAQVDRYKAAAELTGKALANPHHAAAFGPSYQLIRPEYNPHMDQMAGAGLEKTRAEAYQLRGAGTESFSDSGVAPPAGTAYDALGRPTAPMGQGVRPDIVKEQIGAAARVASSHGGGGSSSDDRATRDITRFEQSIEQYRTSERERLERAFLSGQLQVLDRNGRPLQPAKMTDAEREAARAQFDQRARASAQQRWEALRHNYQTGGRGQYFTGRTNPYEGDAPVTAGGNTGQQGPPALGVGGASGNQRAQTPTPGANPAAGQPAPQPPAAAEQTPEARRHAMLRDSGVPNPAAVDAQIKRNAPRGAAGIKPNNDGTVTYVDQNGNPVGTYRYR